MNFKYIVILILNFTSIVSGLCQIYISESIDSEIVFGPNNISNNEALVAEFYISKLNEIKFELTGSIEEEINLINEFKEREKLKRREKKSLKRAYSSKETIDFKIVKIDSILNLWNDLVVFQESLIEASELIKAGKCIKFITETGIYYFDELKIEMKVHRDEIEYKEIIPVEYVLSSTKWVKKKADRNCLSADPNDCLVWCLVETSEGFKFNDMTGNEFKFDDCPTGFKYSELNSECYREMIYNDENELKDEVVILRNRSNEKLTVIDWQTIECD